MGLERVTKILRVLSLVFRPPFNFNFLKVLVLVGKRGKLGRQARCPQPCRSCTISPQFSFLLPLAVVMDQTFPYLFSVWLSAARAGTYKVTLQIRNVPAIAKLCVLLLTHNRLTFPTIKCCCVWFSFSAGLSEPFCFFMSAG